VRILLTGVSGFVGGRLAEAWAGRHQLAGLTRRPVPHLTLEPLTLDLAEHPRRVEDLLEGWKPDWVIHAAAVSRPVEFAQDPARCRRVNVEAPHWIARWCRRHSRGLVAFSSDTVYPDAADPATPAPPDGWRETDPVTPAHQYGRSKAEMEQAVLDSLPEALLLRCSLMWGSSRPGQNSFSGWLLRRLEEGLDVPVFRDNRRALLAVGALTEILDQLLATLEAGGEKARGLCGPLNLGGTDYLSREDFARLLWEHLGLDPALLRPLDTAEAGLGDAAPARELPLDLSKVRRLLGALPTVAEWLPREHPRG